MAVLSLLLLFFAAAQNKSDEFYQSIRNNDLAALRSLVRQQGTAAADSRGQTPLMIAAAFGSFEATQLLVEAGADVKAVSSSGLTALHVAAGAGDIRKVRVLVERGGDIHARSQMGRTPLLVAAYTHGASDIVAFLLGKGADPNTADGSGITALIASASVNDTTSVKLLMEHGADISARANVGQAATALMAAGDNGNVELTRLLLARNAPLNVISAPSTTRVKNGPVAFGSATALHFASRSGEPEVVRLLLQAGALPNVGDTRGMTPLMWAVANDRPNVEIVRLLAKGSDTSIRSKTGESALDWARNFNNPAVMSELKLGVAAPQPSVSAIQSSAVTPREAVERSMSLLQVSSSGMFPKGGCVACHAQPITHMAVVLAQHRGWDVGRSFPQESIELLRSQWMPAVGQSLLQGMEGGGTPDSLLYSSIALAAAGEPPSWNTDLLVYSLLAKQRAGGNWRGVGATRAPIQDGDFSRTAMAIRVLQAYGIPGRKAEIDGRVKRAANWLAKQAPLTTEDRVMQLLGLNWAKANAGLRETRTRELLAQQRSDGGWSQTPYLSSDAYATGQVLYTLRELGVSPTSTAFRRGVDYLLQTQKDDGTWYVKSRAMKIQPYFESGFPYGHDQWISSMATAWAAMALSRSEELPAPASASRRR